MLVALGDFTYCPSAGFRIIQGDSRSCSASLHLAALHFPLVGTSPFLGVSHRCDFALLAKTAKRAEPDKFHNGNTGLYRMAINMSSNNSSPFGSPIYSYTRQQAIEDGVLVDLSTLPISRQHWKLHIVCTSTVWGLIESAVRNHGQDITGTLHDLYCIAKIHISPNRTQDRIHFRAAVGVKAHDFILHCGPGDTRVPVLTLMTPADD
jgi:hypothetical protein